MRRSLRNRPKMRPYIDQMRENMAKALKIDVDQINVKATTEEGLGFTGSMKESHPRRSVRLKNLQITVAWM